MRNNKLIIAAAGSGKTTHLVKEALSVKEVNVLITTFTEANEQEICKKIINKKGYIPKNITVQTWFSFLLQHGVRPYQGEVFNEKINGLILVNKESAQYVKEENVKNHYFTPNRKIYSDKLSKFVIKCNSESNGEVIKRLTRIYSYIFIDEIQDLASYDLDILKLIFESESTLFMVGDIRQVTYLTHHAKQYSRYRNGKIQDFIEEKCPKDICAIDSDSLKASHRNNKAICDFSSQLYPEYIKCEPCECEKCRAYIPEHQGVFLIKEADVEGYCEKHKPLTKLHYKESAYPDLNYGASKGLSFDRVLIYPTEKIKKYLKNGNLDEIETIKAKFYVAITRARYSVGIVCNYDDSNYIEGIEKYNSNELE
jgi:DNA helicase-2/ATP-dependent DNA helicase PcrA